MAGGDFVYRRPGCFWAWFRKRAYYLMLNHLNRHRARLRRQGGEDELPAALERLSAERGTTPAVELERAELRRQIEACLERLGSREQRRALLMLLDQELSYEEIAQAMTAALNTVRSWIRRARIALRLCLAQRFGLDDHEGGES